MFVMTELLYLYTSAWETCVDNSRPTQRAIDRSGLVKYEAAPLKELINYELVEVRVQFKSWLACLFVNGKRVFDC